MIQTNQAQRQAPKVNSELRELKLDELRAVVGGVVVQKTRPDPAVYPGVNLPSK